MARAWVVDLWVKDALVTDASGETHKISPSAQQLKAISTIPEKFRTSKYGRGKRWRVSWYETTNGKKKQRAQLYDTKKDAEQFRAELEDDIRRGRYIAPADQQRKFEDAATIWLESKRKIKNSTWRRYKRELDNYVLPRWTGTPLGSISKEAVEKWVGQLEKGTAPYESKNESESKPLAPTYVRHIVRNTFGGVIRYALNAPWISHNPLNKVEFTEDHTRSGTTLPKLTYAQIEALAEMGGAISGRLDDKALIHLLIYGGLRIGEATALTVEHFDAENHSVRVNQTWTVDRDGQRALGSPKGKQDRTVPIPHFLSEELNTLIKGRAAKEYIFQSPRGGAINDRNWYNRVWSKTRDTVPGAESLRIHDLRHIAATIAIGAGADVKLVQDMLGHKDATETLNTYAELWKDKVDEVARKIEERRDAALKKTQLDQEN